MNSYTTRLKRHSVSLNYLPPSKILFTGYLEKLLNLGSTVIIADTVATLPPPVKNDHPPAFNDYEKTCLADSFQNQCTNSIQSTDQYYLDEVNRIVAQLLDSHPSVNLSPVTVEELNAYIRDLNSNKALAITAIPYSAAGDDTALYTLDARPRALTHLQTAIDTLGDWFRKWRIEVNSDKNAAMYFSKEPKYGNGPRRLRCPQQRLKPRFVSLRGALRQWFETFCSLSAMLAARNAAGYAVKAFELTARSEESAAPRSGGAPAPPNGAGVCPQPAPNRPAAPRAACAIRPLLRFLRSVYTQRLSSTHTCANWCKPVCAGKSLRVEQYGVVDLSFGGTTIKINKAINRKRKCRGVDLRSHFAVGAAAPRATRS
ncbi:hypothetical protein EVAR_94499_1 [Eumeta japonica]|uniref:RNA-directed DNA polymerase from mobile element jockey n=1 Tax=Eumeta variegata TaxID=151549 RepID=A0A4C1UUN4_EUMVA|nr:hypothetical protein EVAR_94499_1 [Eumeta japonica]